MTDQSFIIFSIIAGAAFGKVISWLSRKIPHEMEISWYKDLQESIKENSEMASFDHEKSMPRSSFPEFAFLSFFCSILCGFVALLIPGNIEKISYFSIFLMILVLMSWIDARTYLLPDSIIYPFIWIGMIANINENFTNLQSSVIGAVSGYVCFWLIAKFFALIMKKDGMGNGDFKLLAGIGAWLGWMVLPWVMIFAAFVGLLTAIFRSFLIKTEKGSPIPFGPSLAISGALIGFIQIGYPGGIVAILRIYNLA